MGFRADEGASGHADGGSGDVISRVMSLVRDEGVKARALRGSFWSVAEFGGANALRLASNLILTRLLFPEAFGIMAIVQVVIAGLQMFSDTGIRTSIIQNKRGDDPDFLNTAWTIQVGRGVLLWLATCLLAVPISHLYGEPLLAWILPVAGLNALVNGFQPTRVHTANRHLAIGNLTVITLGTQVVSLLAMAGLAWALQSVWALVFGGLLGMVLKQAAFWTFLPGLRNRFRWEPEAVHNLFHFGKYIFLSTAFGFLIQHADRAILGAFIPLAALGVYTIAYLFANLPYTGAQVLTNKVVLPLYRMRPVHESESNRRQIFRVRRLVIGAGLAANAVLGFGGVLLIETLYDPRYAQAGPIVVLLSAVFVPRIVYVGSGQILLSRGDSRRFLILIGTQAITQTILLLLGVWALGIFGAILAPGFAILLTAPLRVAYSRRYEAWDWKGEATALVLGLSAAALMCWLHWGEIVTLFAHGWVAN